MSPLTRRQLLRSMGTGAAALGVLALYDRLGSDEFDDSDVTTLRTFAGHAAVAHDQVRAEPERHDRHASDSPHMSRSW